MTLAAIRSAVAGLLLLGATPAFAQVAGDYTGFFSFYRHPHLPAELTIEGRSRLDATVTFRHFKESIGTESIESRAAFSGRYNDRIERVDLTFSKWIGPRPDGDWAIRLVQLQYEPATGRLYGDGAEFVKKGSPGSEKMEQRRRDAEAAALRERERSDNVGQRSGEHARAKALIDARDREAALSAAGSSTPRDARQSPIARAGARERCGLLVNWTSRLGREFPGNATLLAASITNIELTANIFRDEEFVPIFGMPYDATTEAWRAEINKHISACFDGGDRQTREALAPFRPVVVPPFGPSARGAAVSPAFVSALIQKRRLQQRELAALVEQPIAAGQAGLTEATARLAQLTRYERQMWPSEIAATRAALSTKRGEVASRLIAQLEADWRNRPGSVANLNALVAERRKWANLIDTIEQPERGRLLAALDAQVDSWLHGLVTEWAGRLQSLGQGRDAVLAWHRWRTDFEAAFTQFADAQRVSAVRAASIQQLTALLTGLIPQLQSRLAALPQSAEGLAAARAFVRPMLDSAYVHDSAAVKELQAALDNHVTRTIAALPALVERSAAGTADDRRWFRSLVDARPASSRDVIRAVGRVRLTLTAEGRDQEWFAAHSSTLRARVTSELASIGVTVDPQAAAELVVRAGRDRSIATVATSSERLELRVQSFLMDATLWAPATVLREGGVYRTRAALSSAADTLVVGETASSWLPFDELVPKVIGGLTTHVDPMSNDLRRESRAREHLLALLPALDARRADFLRSVEQTGDGRVGSLAGIRAVRAEPYDADPIWASQNAPDVGAAWSAGVATLGLIKAPSLVPIAPIHWFNTHSEPLVEVGGDPNNRVRLDVRMDHAALLEEHCFIDHPGGLLKTACYAGSARGFKLQLESEANMSGVEQVVEALFASLRSRSAPR